MELAELLSFEPIKNFILKQRSCSIDNVVYRLHYRVTVLLLIGFCLMVTAKQFFGDPIECIVKPIGDDKEHHLEKVINRYCWIHTTFSVNSAWKKIVGKDVPYPGVDKLEPGEEITYHAYYQWVSFMLVLQAIVFYIPHMIWKCYEANKTKNLLNGLDGQMLGKEERHTRIGMVAEYLLQTMTTHNRQFIVYVFTELLNLVNIIVQIILMDRFLNGKFANYGSSILAWKDWAQFPLQYDPMMEVFPRMTKCTFHQFGPSGDIQKHDTLCVLPINIVNEKGYTVLWFWFYFLAIVSCLSVLYRLLVILLPFLRVLILRSHSKASQRDIQRVIKYGSIGDWFMLTLLAKNMDRSNFGGLLANLSAKIMEKEKIL